MSTFDEDSFLTDQYRDSNLRQHDEKRKRNSGAADTTTFVLAILAEKRVLCLLRQNECQIIRLLLWLQCICITGTCSDKDTQGRNCRKSGHPWRPLVSISAPNRNQVPGSKTRKTEKQFRGRRSKFFFNQLP